MKACKIDLGLVGGWVWLALTLAIFLGGESARAGEQTFKVLRTRTTSYTNVTVTTKAKNYIFILHAAGMANIKLQELPADVLELLGYTGSERTEKRGESAAGKQIIPEINSKLKPLEQTLLKTFASTRQRLNLNGTMIWGAIAIALMAYLFSCYCFQLICLKANRPAGILVWIPLVQLIPLLRAAKMSGWCFLVWWFPVVPILWALNIAKARGKSALVGLLLLIPLTNLAAFLYLAFSSEAPAPVITKYKSMALQTA